MAGIPSEYLAEALGHVLFSMVEMTPRATETKDIPVIKHEALNVRIEYSGNHAGELGLIMEIPLASRIAARILGLQNTDTIFDDMIEDAARELMNVVCGHFVTLMYGYTPTLKVSIPKVLRLGSPACNMLLSNPNVCTFMVEDSPVLGQVRIK